LSVLGEHRHGRGTRRHAARLPFGPGIVATYLHGRQMVCYARLPQMLEGFFGLKISEGVSANMLSHPAALFVI
jgi:hypothetical protein